MSILCCEYSLELPLQGNSDKYPKHVYMEKLVLNDP